jgi:hypothetical protein
MTQTWKESTPSPQPGPTPTPAAAPSGLTRNPDIPGAVLTGFGGLLMIFGSFLPWLTVTAPLIGTISRSGLDGGGDGVITLALGIVTVLIGMARLMAATMPTLLYRASIITGLVAGATAIYANSQVQDRIAQAKDAAGEFAGLLVANTGAGLWTLGIGAALAIIGGMVTRKTT